MLAQQDGLDYVKMKNAILHAYELVPEAYRQRFRGLKKVPCQSYIDFAREKGILLIGGVQPVRLMIGHRCVS